MNIQKLFKIQKELDQRIIENHNLHGKDLILDKILALEVELGELANETKCFKFWSFKDSSPKNVVLEEYVDCLHFILSIGLEKGFEEESFIIKDYPRTVVEQFQEVFQRSTIFNRSMSRENYLELFNSFLTLGKKLGFSWRDMEVGYLMKNEINHKRQEEGY